MTLPMPLPIFFGDVCGSLLGTMYFPDNAAMAKGYAAYQLSQGPLQDHHRDGHHFSEERYIELLDARNVGPSVDEIEKRCQTGAEVARLVEYLWALVCTNPAEASWEAAIKIAIDDASRRNERGTRALFRGHLQRYGRVLHLWGAWWMRGANFQSDPDCSYSAYDDCTAFMEEAMALRQELQRWNDSRQSRSPTGYLSGEFFGPWVGCEPFQWRPDWPDTGRICHCTLSPDHIPQRGRAGRPRRA
jgi:hypothetical protein